MCGISERAKKTEWVNQQIEWLSDYGPKSFSLSLPGKPFWFGLKTHAEKTPGARRVP